MYKYESLPGREIPITEDHNKKYNVHYNSKRYLKLQLSLERFRLGLSYMHILRLFTITVYSLIIRIGSSVND